MPKASKLSEMVQEFHHNGVIFPLRVLSEEETHFYRKEFEQIEKVFDEPLCYLRDLHIHLQWAYDLCRHPKIIEIISQLLGDEICVMGSQILTKYPQTNNYIPWHQDAIKNNWNDSMTVWLAISESNIENGCMQVIPETHLSLKHKHVPSPGENNIISYYNLQIEKEIDESKAVNLELKPGELSVHHQNIFHRSKANLSSSKRIGFAIRFINPKFTKNKDVIYLGNDKRYPTTENIKRPKVFQKKNDPEAYKAFLETRIFSS